MIDNDELTLESPLFKHFGQIKDTRDNRGKEHELSHIIFITICAVTCGADSFHAIEDFATTRKDWISKYIKLLNGIPSHDTFNRVLSSLSPKAFRQAFISWTKEVVELSNKEIVAIDGKTLRRSYKDDENPPIHMVSAWASANGVTLGQYKVKEKSNEITAIPKLLNLLDLKGCIITLDAMGTQKEIARQIIKSKADYVLALKGNQGNLYDEVKGFFNKTIENGKHQPLLDFHETTGKKHGREEHRRYYCVSNLDTFSHTKEWKSLNSIAMVESDRLLNGKLSTERRYYISSLEPKADEIAQAIRSHWSIENSAHWVLDMAFREDECRKRSENAPEIFATLRRVTLNLLKMETTVKKSIPRKRLLAGWEPEYLEKVLMA